MAYDVSGWQWGEDDQYAFDPTSKKYFLGNLTTPAQKAPETYFGADDMGNPIYNKFGEDTPANSKPWSAKGYLTYGDYQAVNTPNQNYAYYNKLPWNPENLGLTDFTGIDKLSPERQKLFTPETNVQAWDQSYGAPARQLLVDPGEEPWYTGFMSGSGVWAPFLGAGGLNALTSGAFGGVGGGLNGLFGQPTGMMGGAEAMNSIPGLGDMGVLDSGLSGFDMSGMPNYSSPEGLLPETFDTNTFDPMLDYSQGSLDMNPATTSSLDSNGFNTGQWSGNDVNMDSTEPNGFETGQWSGSDVNMDYGDAGSSPWEKLQNYMKTPMGLTRGAGMLYNLFSGLQQNQQGKKLMGQYGSVLEQMMKNSFPYGQYQPEMQKFIQDPTAYLKNSAGFNASQDFIKQAVARRNARTGDINSGFGAALSANALGQNAQSWQNDVYKQLAGVSGVGLPNGAGNMATAGLSAGLGQMNNRNATLGNIFTNLIGGMEGAKITIPDLLKMLG